MNKISTLCKCFKALSNESRLNIYLQLIHCCKPGTVCKTDIFEQFCIGELGSTLNIAPSTLSHHIKELHQADLISLKKDGQFIYCSVNPEMLNQMKVFFK